MKKTFAGYYRPNDDELTELWKKCIFVLDANVLLNLYRYPVEAKNDLLKILEKISSRLWMPHQAALEYQENRLRVIADQREKFSEVEDVLKKSQNKLRTDLDELQLEKRHSSIKPKEFLKKVDKAFEDFLKELKDNEQNQQNVFDDDNLRNKIDVLLEGKIGVPPKSQDDLESLYKEGEKRYEYKRPPGYMDKNKKHDPEVFLYIDLVLKRKYGDLLLWHQIIEAAKTREDFKHLILVTDDDKEDWWWVVESQGRKTIGPRPELIEEISSKAGVLSFYVYNPERFIKYAKEYLEIDIQDKSVEQARDIASLKEKEPDIRLLYMLEITDKHFDDSSDPQKLVIRFTNSSSDLIEVSKVLYSDTGLGLPASALATSYRKESRGRYIINQGESVISPNEDFFVEIQLAQKWKREDINKWAGKWGYLRIYVTIGTSSEVIEGFYSI